jgi:hypothetical protein
MDKSFNCQKLNRVSLSIIFRLTVSEVARVIKAEVLIWNYS